MAARVADASEVESPSPHGRRWPHLRLRICQHLLNDRTKDWIERKKGASTFTLNPNQPYLGSKYGASYLTRDAIIANLLLVHGWGHYFAPPLDFPSWSLSCEGGAYLVLPFYLWAVWPVKRATAHLLFIAGYLGLLLWYSAHFGNGTLDRLREQWGLGRCLIEVAIGVSLFQLNALYRSRKMEPIYDAVAAVIFCAIFVVFTYSTYDFYLVPLTVGLILCLGLARGPFTHVLEWRPMVLLGEISFSIYMLHGFVLWLCQDIPS